MGASQGPLVGGDDTERPNPARMYDYALGGAANFAADRAMVEQLERSFPQFRRQARANRAFLRRIVRHLAGAGVRQFLDLGSGVPTVGHVHEVAQAIAPDARVVYVDNEPVAAAHSRQVLARIPGTAVLHEDMRNAGRVLDHPELRAVLDLDQPVAVLMFAVLHFVLDDREVAQLVAAYRDRTVPGSWLAVSHGCADDSPTVQEVADRYERTSQPWRPRSRAQVTALFDGYELVDPGVVWVPLWHPDPGEDANAAEPVGVGGLGRKRSRPA